MRGTASPAELRAVALPEWRKLDPRTLAVHCSWMAAPLAPIVLTAVATNGQLNLHAWITLGSITGVFLVIAAVGLTRWARTRYRVTEDTFEMHAGLFARRFRSIPLHRIRSVELTANPVHRLFGLAVLRAGTASSTGRKELVLEALTRSAAERLRVELLLRNEIAVTEETLLSTIDWRWLRYAPLTFWVFGGVLSVVGTAYRILHEAGIDPWRISFVRQAFMDFGNRALWITIPLVLLGIAVIGSVGAVALYAENWWKFRLEWAESSALRVQRGLLATRSVFIERRRLLGVTLSEPLLLRAGGGATVKAVAGGLGDRDETRRRSALLPPAPRPEALRVISQMLHMPPLDEQVLVAHPRVALRRRLMRGLLLIVFPVTTVLAVLGALLTVVLLHLAWIFLVVAVPIAVWLAHDAYRNLGHTVSDRHLIARSGTLRRETVVLQRDSILAWTFSSSPFARRAGVLTITAAVAAGEHSYRIRDFAATDAACFAEKAAPGILTEFLQIR